MRIVRKHGADKILFATDSPWEDQMDYVNRIQEMPLSAEEKTMIFGENAQKLLSPALVLPDWHIRSHMLFTGIPAIKEQNKKNPAEIW